MGAPSALVALYRMRVLLCARDAVLLRAPVRAGAHVHILIGDPTRPSRIIPSVNFTQHTG